MSKQKTFKTPKGTELPLLDFKGKDYLEVKYRLVWFREEKPNWTIETEFVSVTDKSAFARASVKDESGKIISTSHKYEDLQGFRDFIEKAETGAIGRALALLGFGTQFCADELDEGKRIVDSPVGHSKPETQSVKEKPREPLGSQPVCYCGATMINNTTTQTWYCKDYKDKTFKGGHATKIKDIAAHVASVKNYMEVKMGLVPKGVGIK